MFNFAQVTAALGAASTSPDDATSIAAFPGSDPSNGVGFSVTSAEAKALGLFNGDPNAIDGFVGLSSGAPFTYDPNNRGVSGEYDAIGTLEHEISEVLGRVSFLGQPSAPNTPLDLFRHGPLDQNPTFFSTDGHTNLIGFNATGGDGDPGDWNSSAHGDAFQAVAEIGVPMLVSTTDLREMDVLGYIVNPHETPTAGSDYLVGTSGNDRLDGGPGADVMFGGPGDDTYVVDNQGDVVGELPGQGTDTVEVHEGDGFSSYTLPANVENLVLVTGTFATGNALDNVITGNADNNIIDGGPGADTMIGGAGNDTYFVDNPGDKVVENPGEGIDTINTSVSYTLPANVENLYLDFGAGPLNGTGNELDNVINGNDSGDVLSGGGGNDTIVGGTGPNQIFGGAGDDHITGGPSGDIIDGGDGNDIIDGGAGNDQITGGAGNDQIRSGLGADTIDAGDGNDLVWGGYGADVIAGGAGDDHLYGNTPFTFDLISIAYVGDDDFARDTLTGGPGNDTLDGGGGVDTAVYDVAASTATLKRVGDGSWTVSAGADGVDTLNNMELLQFADRQVSLVAQLAQWSDFNGDGRSDLLIENTGGAVVMGEVAGGQVSYTQIAGLGAEWSFRGNGDFLADGFGQTGLAEYVMQAQVPTTAAAQFLIENANGAVVVGWIRAADFIDNQVHYTQVGSLGPEWTFHGVGDYLLHGDDQFLIENTSGAVVVGEVVNGQASYTSIGGLGPEWKIVETGDFLGHGASQFLIENASGAVVAGEVVGGHASYTQIGGLGAEWKFVGSGDFLGDGKADFLIENTNGAVVVGEVVNGQASYTQIAALGAEWKFVGAGDYLGEGHDQFLIENTGGAVVVGDWLSGQIHYTQVAGLGSEWHFHG
ncbi:MAG: NF038122 family metalloprotease [Caulobacterales bacterium]